MEVGEAEPPRQDRKEADPGMPSDVDHTAGRAAELMHSRTPPVAYRLVADETRDIGWRLAHLGAGARAMFGVRADEAEPTVEWFLARLHPDDREAQREAIARIGAEGRRDETYRVRQPDGRFRWVREVARVFPAHDGVPAEIVGFSFDIEQEQRIEEELDRLSQQVLQAQKLEAIGQLAAGVAHDFNNTLATIQSLASIMAHDLPADGPYRGDLSRILAACRRGRNLTRNLLGFARRGDIQRAALAPGQVVGEALQFLRRTLPKGVTLRSDVEPGLPAVHADRGQLQHALVNLTVNASDAMGGAGTLTLGAALVEVGGEATGPHPDLAVGPYVRFTVADDGPGMDEATRARAFEPFFTTKPAGEATGLGLSMVYGMARTHGGAVVLAKSAAGGTEARLYLPVAAGSPRPEPGDTSGERRHDELVEGSGTILFVDDEKLVRGAGRRLLRRLGYDVLLAEGGEQALEIYREHGDEIRLVLLDMLMPGMDGAETFVALRRLDPAVRVLFLSGYTRERVAQQVLDLGAAGFVLKPFTAQHISAEIERVLAGAGDERP